MCPQKGVSSEHVHTCFKTMVDGESSREHIVSSIVKLSESICEKVVELKRSCNDDSDDLDVDGMYFL